MEPLVQDHGVQQSDLGAEVAHQATVVALEVVLAPGQLGAAVGVEVLEGGDDDVHRLIEGGGGVQLRAQGLQAGLLLGGQRGPFLALDQRLVFGAEPGQLAAAGFVAGQLFGLEGVERGLDVAGAGGGVAAHKVEVFLFLEHVQHLLGFRQTPFGHQQVGEVFVVAFLALEEGLLGGLFGGLEVPAHRLEGVDRLLAEEDGQRALGLVGVEGGQVALDVPQGFGRAGVAGDG